MTRRRISLRARLALTFAALGASVALLLSLAIAYGAHDVAQQLMDQTLSAEIEDYIARRIRNPASQPPAAVGLRGYVSPLGSEDAHQPEAVRSLPTGRHELVIDGTPYRAIVAEHDGWRYVILFDETGQKHREARFAAWLAGGAISVILLVFLGAWWLAGRALAPLSALASAIANADVDRPLKLPQTGQPADEIATLTDAFLHFQARLAKFIERERAFTAEASHELRTPLSIIRGAAELLSHDATLSSAQRERAARIEHACLRLVEFVDTLLLLAREETAEGECEAVSVVRETLERLNPECQKRALKVELAAPPQMLLPLSAPLLAILFGNLLHNACEHARSQIVIELSATALTVRDDGPGMEAQTLAHATGRYWRGPGSRGAGIGLALVARICRIASFSLQLGNAPEGGFIATVKFSLQPRTTAS